MVVIPKSLPWKEVFISNSACFLKDLGGKTWAIGTYDLKCNEGIIDFQDDVVPTFFKSEILANTVLENIDLIFNYLQYKGTACVKNLTATLRKLFNTREESLCEPRDYHTLHWNDVPKADGWAPIATVEFSDHTWGIVANLPEEDFLVSFEPGDPVIKTYHLSKESADEAVKLLFEQCKDNLAIYERFKAVSFAPKPKEDVVRSTEVKLLGPGKFYLSFNPLISADIETVLGIRDDWYNRRTTSGKHCFCHGCVSQAQSALGRIEFHYAGPLDGELTQAIKDAKKWIPVR